MAIERRPIIFDGIYGGMMHLWKANIPVIRSFIKEFGLSSSNVKTSAGKAELRWTGYFPWGMPALHLHFDGRIYEVSTVQWNKFTKVLTKDLEKKMLNTRNVDFNTISAASDLVNRRY